MLALEEGAVRGDGERERRGMRCGDYRGKKCPNVCKSVVVLGGVLLSGITKR
jgi:hypothetical protein